MKLFSGPIIIVAAAVSVNASPTLSAQKRDSPPAPSAQGPLSLKSTLQPLNTTHVNVSITNTYPEDISILYWNTHFQPDQDAAHGSFQVSTASSGGQVQVMQRGPNMAQFYFDSADTSHFYNITAGTTYSDVFDITDVFAIPQAGEYDVVMEFTTRAILFSAGVDLNAEIEAAGPFVDSFSSLEVKSDPITMQLDASPPASSSSKQKRQMTIGSCDSHLNVLPQITTARNNARDLAKYGLNVWHRLKSGRHFRVDADKQNSLKTTAYGQSISTTMVKLAEWLKCSKASSTTEPITTTTSLPNTATRPTSTTPA